MLNKNDPLIGAVQQVMQQSNAEREATRLVNEAFGVEDRKALPHEYQAEWNYVYQQVLSESSFAALAPPYDKATQKDRLVGAGVLKKHPTKPGKHVLAKEEEQLDERKVNPYAIGMAAVKKSTGDEPPMEKKNIMKAHKIAKKIMKKKAINEKYIGRSEKDIPVTNQQSIQQQKKTLDAKAPGMGGPNYNPNKSLDAKAPGMGGPNYNPNKSLDAKAPGMGGPNYVPNKGTNNAPPKPKVKPADLNTTPNVKKKVAPKAAAPKASAPKAAAQPKKKLTAFQKSMINQKGNTEDQKRQLERRYGVRAPMKKAKRSVFGEQIRDIIAERMSSSAGAQGGVNAASIEQQKAAVMQKRKDLGTSVMSGRVGDPGKQNFIQNARAQKEREKAAGGDGTKYLPVPPNVQKAIKDNQPQPGRPQTLSPGANPPAVSKNMGGGSGDYRSAQAKVSPGTQQKVKKGDTMWGYAKQDIKQSRNLAASGPLGGNAFGGNAGTSGAELVKRKITNKDIAAKTEKIKALNPTVNPRKMQIGSTIKTN